MLYYCAHLHFSSVFSMFYVVRDLFSYMIYINPLSININGCRGHDAITFYHCAQRDIRPPCSMGINRGSADVRCITMDVTSLGNSISYFSTNTNGQIAAYIAGAYIEKKEKNCSKYLYNDCYFLIHSGMC